MKWFQGAALAAILVSVPASMALADEAEAKAVLKKGIKALGGAEKLGKGEVATWKAKSTMTLGGNENTFNVQATLQGLDHYRAEVEGEFNGNPVKGVVVLCGDKGWRKFGDDPMEMDGDGVANEKRTIYLQAIPTTLLPLKAKGFKIESAPEEKVGDKPAAVLKGSGPDGKDFTLYFDKESGLPVKLVGKVIGWGGEEFTQETTYADYKDFDGIKKATKVESKRDGEKFVNTEISDFKVLDKAPADAFAEPK